jgi:hypothetical protein
MINVLNIYLKYHPLYNNSNLDVIPLLVNYKGNHLNNINSINIILSKINPNFNTTMIRHSYLGYEFNDIDEKSKNISYNMCHS